MSEAYNPDSVVAISSSDLEPSIVPEPAGAGPDGPEPRDLDPVEAEAHDGTATAHRLPVAPAPPSWTRVLRDHWLSMDLRTLGLFRIAFGICLIANLIDHWIGGNLTTFFSNDGVLTNHYALFAPIQQRVW